MLFGHKEFVDHEQVSFFEDKDSGLKAIVAVHSTTLGNSLGGCRMWPYASEEEALNDVLRLSRGMTYKCAAAGLPLGGGKSVIIADPAKHKSPELFRAMGRCLNSLGGKYIAAEDSGTTVEDLKTMGEETSFVAGVDERKDILGNTINGDPSPATALGVFNGIQAAMNFRHDKDDLKGVVVNVQGMGNVGLRLVAMLTAAGARVNVNDIHPDRMSIAVNKYNANPVSAEEIISLSADVYAPCAMGATINDESVEKLNVSVVAGAANNQLASDKHGEYLLQRGILYAPDYVINGGGIIDCCLSRLGKPAKDIVEKVEGIGKTLFDIFIAAEQQQKSTAVIANYLAEKRLGML